MIPSTEKPIPNRLFFRIGDVSGILGVKPYVLRYWESEFSLVQPQKSKTGQRVYQKRDVENLMLIKHLLYRERYSIEGARKRLGELRKGGEIKVVKAAVVPPSPAKDFAAGLRKIRIEVRELIELNRKYQF